MEVVGEISTVDSVGWDYTHTICFVLSLVRVLLSSLTLNDVWKFSDHNISGALLFAASIGVSYLILMGWAIRSLYGLGAHHLKLRKWSIAKEMPPGNRLLFYTFRMVVSISMAFGTAVPNKVLHYMVSPASTSKRLF